MSSTCVEFERAVKNASHSVSACLAWILCTVTLRDAQWNYMKINELDNSRQNMATFQSLSM